MKKTATLFLLVLVLIGLLVVKYRQIKRPLYPDIVSLDNNRRNMALTRLKDYPNEKKIELRDQLRASLKDPHAHVRRHALYTLRIINFQDEKTWDMVAFSFGDEDASVREEAINILLGAGDRGIPMGLRILEKAEGTSLLAAGVYFDRLAPDHVLKLRPVVSGLGSFEGKRKAGLLLVAKSTQGALALPVFEACLQKGFDKDVVKALVKLGPEAKSMVPLLRKQWLGAKDSFLDEDAPRVLIACALSKVDPRSTTLNSLSWDLKNKDPLVRYRAVYEWGQKKDLDVGAIPAMVNVLNDPERLVAARAAEILVRLDLKNVEPLSNVANPALRNLIRRVSDEQIEGFRDRVGTPVETLLQTGRR